MSVKIQAPAQLRPGETITVEGATPTLEMRRQAVDEVRGEVLALLGRIVEGLENQPPIISPSWAEKKTNIVEDLKAVQAAAMQEVHGPLQSIPGPRPKMEYIPGPLHELARRLLWLLALSPEERGFVEAAAQDTHLGRPDNDSYSHLAVFCDYLKDQGRDRDAATVEALVPEDGSVIVITVPAGAGPLAVSRAYEEIGRPLQEGLTRLGRRVHVCAVREGNAPRVASADEMRKTGWVRQDDPFCVCKFDEAGVAASTCAFHANEIGKAVMREREACAQLVAGAGAHLPFGLADAAALIRTRKDP